MTLGDHYQVACGFLKLPPSEFWQLTPMELDRLCDSHLKANPKYVEPLSVERFDELRDLFPARVDRHGRALPGDRAHRKKG